MGFLYTKKELVITRKTVFRWIELHRAKLEIPAGFFQFCGTQWDNQMRRKWMSLFWSDIYKESSKCFTQIKWNLSPYVEERMSRMSEQLATASGRIQRVHSGNMHKYGHRRKVFSLFCVFFAKRVKNGNPLILQISQNKMWYTWVFIFLWLCLMLFLAFSLHRAITHYGRDHGLNVLEKNVL